MFFRRSGSAGHWGPPPADLDKRRVEEALEGFRRRTESAGHDRLRQLRLGLVLAVQAGLAAALAWFVAHHLLQNPQPVFAPTAAVGTIVSSIGRRLRRSVELIVGVAVGVAIGDFLVLLLGVGPWQLGVIVVLAVVVALVVGGRGTLVAQAGSTAVLVATLAPAAGKLEFPRFVDASVGGAIGMIVVVLLLPLNPLRAIERAVVRPGRVLADQLAAVARALTERDAAAAEQALTRLQSIDQELDQVREAVSGAQEVVELAPARWHRRRAVGEYANAVEQLDHAAFNSKALIRRAVTVIEDGEPVPAELPSSIGRLAEAVRLFRQEFTGRPNAREALRSALLGVSEAAAAREKGVGFSGTVVVAQVRTITSDLLRASGIDKAEANRLVHRVASRAADGPPADPARP